MATGVITAIIDHGSIVQFFIECCEDGGLDVVCGEGNLTREALADSGIVTGDTIEYELTDDGRLVTFAPVEG